VAGDFCYFESMKTWIPFLFILFLNTLQASELDSLREQLFIAADAEKAVVWSDLGYVFEKNEQMDSALFCYRQAVQWATTYRMAAVLGRNLRYQGMIYLVAAQYDSAAFFLKQAIRNFTSDSLRLDRAKAWVDLGNVCYHIGKVDSAATIYLQAARLFDEMGMTPQAGIVYGNLGTLHMELDHFKEAIHYHQLNYNRSKAAALNQHTARAAYNLGGALDAANELKQAQLYYDSALDSAQ